MVGLTPGNAGGGFNEYGAVFRGLNTLSALLSIAGCIAIVVTFLLHTQLRRFFGRLILYLAISDLWLCTAMLMGQSTAPHYTKCYVQSGLGTFFGLASILWTVAIADSLRRVLLAHDLSLESKYEMRLHLFAWGLPSLAVAVCIGAGVFGPAGMMCWIRNTVLGTVIRFVTFYIPLWIAIGYSVWVYWEVTALMGPLIEQQNIDGERGEASSQRRQDDIKQQRRALRCLLLLPLTLVFCWTPSSIRRVIDIFIPDLGWTPLDYICVLAGPLQGALNAVIYGATPAVREAVMGRFDHSTWKLRLIQTRLRGLRQGIRSFEQFEDGDMPAHTPHRSTGRHPSGATPGGPALPPKADGSGRPVLPIASTRPEATRFGHSFTDPSPESNGSSVHVSPDPVNLADVRMSDRDAGVGPRIAAEFFSIGDCNDLVDEDDSPPGDGRGREG